jgi:hypothetical protein
MLHVLRVGCPWRDMPERYGKWNSVYVRLRRWAEQDVWDAMLATRVEFGLTDAWQHMIDSTTVRGHVSAAGAKGGLVRRLLVNRAVALRARSTPAATRPRCHSPAASTSLTSADGSQTLSTAPKAQGMMHSEVRHRGRPWLIATTFQPK